MSIVQSIVKIYDDQQKTTLITSVTTQGASTAIGVDELDEGQEYWATATVQDDAQLWSNESATYRFYTLPDVVWHTGSPAVSGDTIGYQIDVVTNTVGTSQVGIVYSTDPSMATYSKYYTPNRADGDLHGLAEHTTYYVAPYCIDEFNREWINFDGETSLTTPYAIPTLAWTGISSLGVTTWTNQITVTSTDTVSAVTVTYQAQGGAAQTLSLQARTGAQNVSLTGLNPDTPYTVTVTATNSAGTGTSSTQSFRTSAGGVQVDTLTAVVNNSNNNIAATGRAQANDPAVTITGIALELWSNNSHTGTAIERIPGTSPYTSISDTFTSANPDVEYYVFTHVTYTVSGGATQEAWSSPLDVRTYALLSFGSITTNNNSATINYSVNGVATSGEISYSVDNSTWIQLPISNWSGGSYTLTGLSASTSYYLRGKVQSTAGWQDYITTTFATTGVLPTVTVSSVTNITPTEAQVNLSIS